MNDQTELEQEIIASILTKPELFLVVRISERWFTNPDYKIVFEAISKSGGSFSSIFEIAKIILDMGYEQISVSRLTEIKNSIATTEHFRSKVQLLETSYLETNLRELSFEYSKSPRTETLSAMVDYAMLLQSKSVKSESGSMVEVINQYEKNLYEDLPDRTIKTYWQFDNAFGGLYPGMLFTIGARPGVGKTAFAVVNLVLKALHRNQGLSVDIFTLEMQRRELLLRYASNLTGINGYRLRKPNSILTDAEKVKVKEQLEYLKGFDLKVYDQTFDLHSIIYQIRDHVTTSGNPLHLVVIDYLGLITLKQASGRVEPRLRIEEITRQLKLLANELGIVIVLLSQLNRGIEARQDKTPVLGDLRESGSIEQDSNVVGFLYKDPAEERNRINFIIRKNREGQLAQIRFKYNGDTMHFEEISDY